MDRTRDVESKPPGPGKWAFRPLFFVFGAHCRVSRRGRLDSSLGAIDRVAGCSQRIKGSEDWSSGNQRRGVRDLSRHSGTASGADRAGRYTSAAANSSMSRCSRRSVQSKGRGDCLRIVVDKPRCGRSNVPIERCVEISREIETLLDATDASAAMSWRLSTRGVFTGAGSRAGSREGFSRGGRSSEIKLRTRRPIDGRKTVSGPARFVRGGPIEGECRWGGRLDPLRGSRKGEFDL